MIQKRVDQLLARAPVDGVVKQFNLPAGRPVAAGDVLFVIDTEATTQRDSTGSGLAANASEDAPPITRRPFYDYYLKNAPPKVTRDPRELERVAQVRSQAKKLAQHASELRAELRYEDAELVEHELNKLLHGIDPDQQRIAALRASIVDARIAGEHERAESLTAEADRLRRELDRRYGIEQHLRREAALAEAIKFAARKKPIESAGGREIKEAESKVKMEIYTSVTFSFTSEIQRHMLLTNESQQCLKVSNASSTSITVEAMSGPGGTIRVWTAEGDFTIELVVASEYETEYIQLKQLPPSVAELAISEELSFSDVRMITIESGDNEVLIYGLPETIDRVKLLLASAEKEYVRLRSTDPAMPPKL